LSNKEGIKVGFLEGKQENCGLFYVAALLHLTFFSPQLR
jgi:hypothetical protein